MWKCSLTVAALMFSTSVIGCSVPPSYRVPTNVEMLQKSDLVVLATVTAGPRNDQEAVRLGDAPRVILTPVRVLKGTAPSQLHVEGDLSDQDGHPYPFAPTGLDDVHPSALEGGCIRERYSKGSMVLAMFRQTERGYVQLNDAFARAVEDVQGPSALWPRAAELYLRLLESTRATERRAAFSEERRRLLAIGSPAAKAVAADIGRYLKQSRK